MLDTVQLGCVTPVAAAVLLIPLPGSHRFSLIISAKAGLEFTCREILFNYGIIWVASSIKRSPVRFNFSQTEAIIQLSLTLFKHTDFLLVAPIQLYI